MIAIFHARTLLTACFCAIVLSAAGCTTWTKPKDDLKEPPRQANQNGTPTVEQLVKYLNEQSSQIQMLDAKDITLEVQAQGQRVPSLGGYLVCEKPRNFKLMGKSPLAQEVDLGSNNDQFWYWVKRSPEPYVFYCRYADFDKGVQLPFPFQPEWVLEVLGMGEYPNPDRCKMEVRNQGRKRVYELTEETESQGQRVTKVTRINDFNAAPPVPQVIGKELYDSHNKLIARATIDRTQYDKRSHMVVPYVVTLEYPAQQVTMKITLDGISVNKTLRPEESAKLFSRPEWRDTKSVDLASMLRGNPTSNIRQAGGRLRP